MALPISLFHTQPYSALTKRSQKYKKIVDRPNCHPTIICKKSLIRCDSAHSLSYLFHRPSAIFSGSKNRPGDHAAQVAAANHVMSKQAIGHAGTLALTEPAP